MAIKETIQVLDAMVADGVIERYAIAGAVAAYNYVEPTLTNDLDLLVSLQSHATSGLVTLTPILSYLKAKGYDRFEMDGLIVEGWPIQFLPVASALDEEALMQAQEAEVAHGVRARVLQPEHLVAIALRTGRPKGFTRIAQFIDEAAVDLDRLCNVIGRHGLADAWRNYCRRTGTPDPCGVQKRQ